MNKNFHRIVFNAARGMRMVVQETARSAGKASGATPALLGTALAALLVAPLAQSQIAADPNAPGSQRATVVMAPNGVPLVNIQTPSAAGVSRNVYRQFDVDSKGAILNNSRSTVQTQLGGYVQGNPWLARGSARVILNEVNSADPSRLHGYVEVAGPRTEVVIANPAGIQVDGSGFINTSRVTLTTGTPQFNAQGGLENFVVRGGGIGIEGAGLDARSTDYAALLARAVQLNAGIWANELKIVTGANQIGADTSQTLSSNPVAMSGAAPAFALDVAQLGGMYANKITLVGTEAGVGMRNAGTLGAGAGGLVVTAAGRLETTGTLEAPRLDIASAGDIVNRGTIRQNGGASLTITAPMLSNTAGGTVGAEPMPADSANAGNAASGSTASDNLASAAGSALVKAPGTVPSTASAPAASTTPAEPGRLGAASTLHNDGGRIYAGGPIHLQTPLVDNAGGRLDVASMAVAGPSFSNAGGVLNVQQGFSADVARFDNTGGRLQASSLNIRTGGDLHNRGGTLTTDGDATLAVGGELDNTDGRISAGHHTTVVAGSMTSDGTGLLGAGVRADGSLGAAGDLRVTSAGLLRAAGTLWAAGDMAVAGAQVDLAGSRASAAAIALTATQGDVVTRGATVSTSGTLAITADAQGTQTLINDAGLLSAGRVVLSASNIANLHGGQIVQTGADAQRIAVQGTLDNTDGVIASNAQDLALAANRLVNTGGTVQHVGNGTLSINSAAFSGAGGSLVANAALDVKVGGAFDQASGQISAGRLAISAGSLDNRGGSIVQTGSEASRIQVVGTFDNNAGRIASNGQNVALAADRIVNTGGHITHAGSGTLRLDAATAFDGTQGQVVSNGALDIHAGRFVQDGGTTTAQHIAVGADSLSNRAGEIVQSGGEASRIVVAGALDNSNGRIASNGRDLNLQAVSLSNEHGRVEHAGTGTLAIGASDYQGAQGLLASQGALSVQAGRFDQSGGNTSATQLSINAAELGNRGGQIVQTGSAATRIAIAGVLDNDGGLVASNGGDVAIAAGALSNAAGQIQHAGSGTLSLALASMAGTSGQIVGNGALIVQASGAFAQDGGRLSAEQVTIDAASLSNRAGEIVQRGPGTTRIAVGGTLDNTSGRIASAGNRLDLAAATFDGAQGSLLSAGALNVQAQTFRQDCGNSTAGRVSIDTVDLSNRSGTISQIGAGTTRIAASGTLTNDGGVLQTNGENFSLSAGQLSNAAGTIQHAGTGELTLQATDYQGAGGHIASNGSLAVHTTGAFQQDGGTTRAERIRIDVGALSNRSGQIVQAGSEATHIAIVGSFDNAGGTLLSNGRDITLSAATLINQGGSLLHAGTGLLAIDAGRVEGAYGTVASNGALALHAGRIDQDGGSVTAQQIAIDTVDLRNVGGRIVQSGNGATRIAASGLLANDGGTLASNGSDVAISAGSLSNAAGHIRHAGVGELGLTVGDYQGTSGEIASSGSLVIKAAGVFQQDGGTASADRIGIEAGMLSNRSGKISQTGTDSTQIAVAGTFDNTGGQLATNGALEARVGQWTQDGGATRAGRIAIEADALSNIGGQIVQLGDQATQIRVAGILTNDGGTIASNGTDMGVHAATISNDRGELRHAGSGTLSIDASRLDGDRGRIVSNGALVVHSDRFGQDGGSTSAHQVSIDTVDLSNRGGTISQAGAGTTHIAASGTLANDGGTLQTHGDNFALAAGQLSNAAGTIQHTGNGELTLRATDYQGTGGHIASNGSLAVQTTGAFQQDGGTTRAERIRIDAGALSNRSGQIVQVGSDASRIAVVGTLDNGGGLIGSNAQDLRLSADTLVNEAGTVQHAGRGTLAVDARSFLGANGTLASNGTLALQAASVVNDGAGIHAGQVGIDADTLGNRGGEIVQTGAGTARVHVAGQLDNSAGLIGTATGSGAAIDIAVQTIANAGGRIAADGDLRIRSTGDLRNDGGLLRAGGNLDLKAEGTVGNARGRIEAAGETASLALQAGTIDNTDGRIANAGSGSTMLTAAGVTNASTATDGSTGLIAGNGTVVVSATTLRNLENSHLSSGGAMQLNVGDRLTNRGDIASNGALVVDQPGAALDNTAGRISAAGDLHIAVRDLVNDGGRIATTDGSGGALVLDAVNLSNVGGTLSSDRDLRLALPGGYRNDERLHAGRNLHLTLGGGLDNRGTLEAAGTLRTDVASLNNTAGARIQAEQVDLHASGGLDNRGEITGGSVAMTADSVTNADAGAITGGRVTLAARSIVNVGPQALIGATDNVALWATDSLSNTAGATIYSGGDLQVGANAARGPDGRLTGNTGMVFNSASTIEAERDIEIAASSLRNERQGVAVVQRAVQSLDERHYMSMPGWWRNADGNNFFYNPNASNYFPFEVYYVSPSDIINRSVYITPDGFQIERVEYRTHANDTAFFSGRAGRSSAFGHRERLSATEGTRVLYAIRVQNGASNPDQVPGITSGVWEGEQVVTNWDAAAPAFNAAYGNCSTDCVRFVTQPGYTDPTSIMIRDTQLSLPGVASELARNAHTVAYDDVQAPGAGDPGRIVAGRDIRVGFTNALVNSYADILAGGQLNLTGPGAAVVNEGATLYRHYQFDGLRIYSNGSSLAYTRPELSVAIGTVGGVLSGAQGVTIVAKDVRNVDTTAGSASNIVAQVRLASGGTPQAGGAVDAASASAASGAATSRADAATGQAAGGASGPAPVTGPGQAVDRATGQTVGTSGSGTLPLEGSVASPARGFNPTPAGSTTAAAASGTTAPAASATRGIDAVAALPTGTVPVLTGGLYTLRPEPSSSYLYETRPAFANYRDWLSSDYLVKAMGLDPNNIQKRLGDGFYEQKLIREQVVSLTGRRYLDGYASDDAQYAALMTAGATFAQQYGLRPGIALTSAQMAALTSDIVWLQTQTVTLPDGRTQDVLVPKVYVAQAGANSLEPSGALITGDDIHIEAGNIVNRGGSIGDAKTQRAVIVASADIVNQGGVIRADAVGLRAGGDILNQTLTKSQTYGQNDAQVTATGSITSLSNVARIEAKDHLVIEAGRDVVDTAGRIDAGGTASVTAGRDVKFDALTTGSSYQAQIGASSMVREATQANVGQVSAGKDLQIVAGRDLTLSGTQATAGGNATLAAGRDLRIAAATSSQASDQRSDPAGNSYRQTRSETTVQGASVKAGGNLIANAGTKEMGDLTVTGSQLQSNGLTALHASGNVVIEAARETSARDDYTNVSKSGLLSKKTTVEHEIKNSVTAVRSSVSGALTAITAGNDIAIEGARIKGSDGVMIAAGNQLTITEARNTNDSSYQYSTRKSGLGFTNGLIVPEKKAASDATTAQSNTAVATTIDSQNGGVLLKGQDSVQVQGAQVEARKDLTITGGTVVIAGATNYESSSSERYRKDSHLNGILTSSAGGINAKRTDTSTRQATSLAETTLDGANVDLTATGADGQGGTLYVAGTQIDTAGKLNLNADQLILGTQTTQVDVSSTSEGRDLMWQKAKGEGSSDQTTHYVQMNAGQIATGVRGVQAGLGARDSIQSLAQQPGMGWVNQLQNDPKLAGKVDWVKVEEAHTKWQYDKQGLTPGGAAIVTLVAAYFTAGAASGAGASAGSAAAVGAGEGVAMAGGGTFLTATGATISGVVGGAVTAGVTALASQAAVAVINNKGDLGGALHDLGSSASVKSLATAIVTGGVLGGLNLNPTGTPTVGGGAQGFMNQLGQNLQAGAAKAVIGTAINGGSFEDNLKANLKNALLDTAAAQSAFAIGDMALDDFTNKLAHAIAGCAVGAARADGSCAAGALGAAVGELAAEAYGRKNDTVQFASMIGGIAVAVAGGDARQINLGSQAGGNAAANNYLNHSDALELRHLTQACKTKCTPSQLEQLAALLTQDSTTTAALNSCAAVQTATCKAVRADYAAAAASFLPTDADISEWSRQQSAASKGAYTAAEIYDAYRVSFIAGAEPNSSVDDLSQVADWMRGRIVGDGTAGNPGEGPLSVIAMGWAVGNNASAQGALSSGLLALAGTIRVATIALETGAATSPATLVEQQRIRLGEIATQFNDKSLPTANMTLRLGGKTLAADPAVSQGAPVFIGATDAEIAGYFKQIAGINTMPTPSAAALAQGKIVYSTKIAEGEYAGTTIALRDFSSSSTSTGAKWTIEIKGNPAGINANRAEIKFK